VALRRAGLRRPLDGRLMRWLVLIVLALLADGCSRAFYRRQADKESYHAIDERNHDPRWAVPRIALDTPPQSRLHDPFNPDHPPMPPDDPAAHRYMHCANGLRGYLHWHKDGDAPWIEDPEWLNSLSLTPDGVLVLTPERAVEVGLLDSRTYQQQLDNLYLTALALTLNRFEFALHWFGTNDTTWTHFGSGADEQNTLNTSSTLGFTRALTSGGQLMVELANSFVFQYAGPDSTIAVSNIMVNLVKPVLRGAGRDFRMEGLTQAERTLLYTLRDFARFRKQYSFDVFTNTYLQLLAQEQQIRNQRQNLDSLNQSYRLHRALLDAGILSSVKVDQVFQSVQQGELALIQAEASLETSEDNYKNTLGLPPSLPIRLDDSLLTPFQLADPALIQLQKEIEAFQLTQYQQLDQTPPLVMLKEEFGRLKAFYPRILKLVDQLAGELERWKKQQEEPNPDKDQVARQRIAHQERTKDLDDVRADLGRLGQAIERDSSEVAENTREESWKQLQRRTEDEAAVVAQMFVIQNQVRVYLIHLKPVEYDLPEAIAYALANRLDLMNQRAKVVDAWRQLAVTANLLRAGLDLMTTANIATPPFGDRPFDFRSSAGTYSVGFHFEAPLNRVAERNAYRTSQVNYQEARYAFMSLEDQVVRQIRLDLRSLKTDRLSFEIARQSLIAAVRQVESAREELKVLEKDADPTSTINILNALSAVLSAQNSLISSWVSYETGRIKLLLVMEALQLDDQGLYTNGQSDRPDQPVAGSTADADRPAAS
jgi:outer membrane protein TolC